MGGLVKLSVYGLRMCWRLWLYTSPQAIRVLSAQLMKWRHTSCMHGKKSGNHGLLAHNYLAGRYFFNIQVGDIVTLVFGDGYYEDFEVTSINEYQALQPDSPYSEFIDLGSGEQLTATNLFMEVYMGDFHTTLQTCIANGAETEWGRRFTLAPPMY